MIYINANKTKVFGADVKLNKSRNHSESRGML